MSVIWAHIENAFMRDHKTGETDGLRDPTLDLLSPCPLTPAGGPPTDAPSDSESTLSPGTRQWLQRGPQRGRKQRSESHTRVPPVLFHAQTRAPLHPGGPRGSAWAACWRRRAAAVRHRAARGTARTRTSPLSPASIVRPEAGRAEAHCGKAQSLGWSVATDG